jgi:hypothetical protein
MPLTIHILVVDFGMESIADLPSGTGYIDRHAAFMDQTHLQAMRPQPANDRIDVRARWPELRPQLIRSEPFVIARGMWILQFSHQPLQRPLTLRAAPQNHKHVIHPETVGYQSLVELCSGKRVGTTVQLNQI